MADARLSDTSAPSGQLPDEIYIAFVDGLLDDVVPVVLFSAIAVTCGEVATAFASGQPVLLYAAAAQIVIATFRLYFVRRHARSVPSASGEIARHQERIFSFGALLSLFGLSLWTLLAFSVTDNSFAQFIGVSMTIAYAFSLMSRSYAIYRGVNMQLVAAFAPLSAAMLVAGGWYPMGIVVGIAPLVLYMKGSSERLRANFNRVPAAAVPSASAASVPGISGSRLSRRIDGSRKGQRREPGDRRLGNLASHFDLLSWSKALPNQHRGQESIPKIGLAPELELSSNIDPPCVPRAIANASEEA
jgi:hypothetical protein